jgi:Mrp family chromosome partitioning ATPase
VPRPDGRRAPPPALTFESLERSLDRTIARLTAPGAGPEARALLIEARRLRSVVANWRSIPPPPDAHEEMLDRVLHLSTAAGGPTEDEQGGYGGDASYPEISREQTDYGRFDDAENEQTEVWTEGGSRRPGPSTWQVQEEYVVHAERVVHGEPVEVARYDSIPASSARGVVVAEAVIVSEPHPVERQRSAPPHAAEGFLPDDPIARAGGAFTAEVQVVVRELRDPVDPLLVLLCDPYSDRADAFRSLRRKLATAGGPRVIAVSSAEACEGKTTSALNLALALREGARGRVLLVEANLRAPRLAALLGFEPPECLSDQLLAHRTDPARPWVAVEQVPPLHVMAVNPAGKHPPVLDAVSFASGMESLKHAGYDYIIVDTPPVLGGVDTNLVADHVDGIVLTTRVERSTRRSMKRAADQLSPAPILGVLMIEA